MTTTKIKTYSTLPLDSFNQRNLMFFYRNRWDEIYEDIEDSLMTDGKVTVDLIVRI